MTKIYLLNWSKIYAPLPPSVAGGAGRKIFFNGLTILKKLSLQFFLSLRFEKITHTFYGLTGTVLISSSFLFESFIFWFLTAWQNRNSRFDSSKKIKSLKQLLRFLFATVWHLSRVFSATWKISVFRKIKKLLLVTGVLCNRGFLG